MNLATISTRRALGVNRQVRVGLKAESLAGPRQKGRRRYKDSKRSRDRLERWTWVNKMYSWAGRLCFGIASFEGRQSHPYSLLLQRLTRIVHAEGIHATLKKLKEERVHFYRLLSECGDEGGRSQALVQLRKRFGVPLVEVVQKSLNADKTALDELRMFQTVLTSLAFLRASGDLDVSPVTDPFLGLGWEDGWVRQASKVYVRMFPKISVHQDLNRRRIAWVEFHQTSKAGPNGKKALWHSWGDLRALAKHPEVYQAVRFIGGPKFQQVVSVLEEPRVFEALKDLLPTESQVLRRFAARADKELKVRLIGLGDYMSQTVLKRPNKEAFSWLASLPQDMTFSQDSSAEIIKSWTGRFHCFDLTSATDRFPIRFIRYPVAAAYGEEYASAWVTVTTGLPFTYVTRAGVVSEASYAVGNPLGFLSSWAYFTWGGHHFVMFLCLLEQLWAEWGWGSVDYRTASVKVHRNTVYFYGPDGARRSLLVVQLAKRFRSMRYLMLGDDVIVGDDVLASLYLSWMARLGVEISTLKRYVSTVFATFAKRTYIRTSEGMVEFTGLSLSAVRGTEKSVGLLVSALRGERKKGIRLTKPMGEAVELLEQALGYPRGFRAVRVRKRLAQMTETVLDMVEGRVPVEECVSTLLDLSRLPNKLDELSAEERKLSSGRLVQQVCLQLFQEALSYSGDRGEGVGDYVIDLLFAFIKMTDRESRSPGGPEPFCLPNTRRGSLVWPSVYHFPPHWRFLGIRGLTLSNKHQIPPFLSGEGSGHIHIWVSRGSEVLRYARALPLLAVYEGVEKAMVRILSDAAAGSFSPDTWSPFLRAFPIGLRNMDPRISERKKTAVMCVRFVQALERRYQELYLSDQSTRSRRALRRNLLLCGVRKDKVTDALIDRVSKTQKEIFQMRFGPLGKGETESSRSLAILSSIVPMVFHRNESLQRAGRKLTRPLGGAKYDPASELGDIRRVMSLTSFHKYTKQLRGVGEGPGRVPTPVSESRRRKNQSYWEAKARARSLHKERRSQFRDQVNNLAVRDWTFDLLKEQEQFLRRQMTRGIASDEEMDRLVEVKRELAFHYAGRRKSSPSQAVQDRKERERQTSQPVTQWPFDALKARDKILRAAKAKGELDATGRDLLAKIQAELKLHYAGRRKVKKP